MTKSRISSQNYGMTREVNLTYPKFTDHPTLAVLEPPRVCGLWIRCVRVVAPSPSYLLATIRHGHKPREVLSYNASKDARVGAHFVAFLVHEGAAQ
jgi:hypothetical protein